VLAELSLRTMGSALGGMLATEASRDWELLQVWVHKEMLLHIVRVERTASEWEGAAAGLLSPYANFITY